MGNKTKQTIIKEKCVDMNISESNYGHWMLTTRLKKLICHFTYVLLWYSDKMQPCYVIYWMLTV